MIKVFEKLCDGVVKEWGMIVALVLLAMPPMLFHPVFFGGLHNGLVNGFDAELWRQLKYPVVDMGILMFFTLIVVCLVHLMGKKWVKWVVYGFAIVLASARIWLWWVFRMRITPLTLSLLLQTNSLESGEFVRVYLLDWYGIGLVGIVLGLVGLCFVCEMLSTYFSLKVGWRRTAIYVSVFCLIWGAVEMRWYVKLLRCDVTGDIGFWQMELGYADLYGMSNFEALTVAVVGNICVFEDVKRYETTACEVNYRKSEVSCDNDSLLVVFVLGESYIKCHCGLYGSKRNTTPLLNSERRNDHLYVFNDVVTPYTQTAEVVKTVFYSNSLSENWYESAFFPHVFRLAGFEVDVWDSQKTNALGEVFTFDMNMTLYNNSNKRYSFSNQSDAVLEYDEMLIDDYEDRCFNLDCNRLIIFHLLGQHLNASSRFPHTRDNMIFSGTDEKSEKIAMYDNACVYNDKVLVKIINLVRDEKSVVVYFSDHGEEVYSYRDCYGRKAAEPGFEKEFMKYQAEIPFMIWYSDKYKEAYPEIVEDIEKSVNKSFITDNVCQVMFHLAGLKSPWYIEERDLLSEKYKCGKRIVNGEYDYDEVMSRK